MNKQQIEGEKLTGWRKMAVELGPLVAFLIGYFQAGRVGPPLDNLFGTELFALEGREVFTATVLLLPAFLLATAYTYWKERRVPAITVFTAVVLIGFSAPTLIFQSKIFYYMKSTFAYLMFAGLLGGGLLLGRNFLQTVLSEGISMPENAWRALTWRFTALFLALAVGNEILWRTMTPGCDPDAPCDAEKLYVQIETLGFPVLIIIFVVAQAPFIAKYMKDDDEAEIDTIHASATLKAEPTDKTPPS